MFNIVFIACRGKNSIVLVYRELDTVMPFGTMYYPNQKECVIWKVCENQKTEMRPIDSMKSADFWRPKFRPAIIRASKDLILILEG